MLRSTNVARDLRSCVGKVDGERSLRSSHSHTQDTSGLPELGHDALGVVLEPWLAGVGLRTPVIPLSIMVSTCEQCSGVFSFPGPSPPGFVQAWLHFLANKKHPVIAG